MGKIFSYLSSHRRIGGKKIIKPHCISIFVDGIWIDMKFTEKEYDLMWEIKNVINKEMELNYKESMKN